MRNYSTFRGKAIRYWESRRFVYNIALIPPALVAFIATDVMNYVGDPHPVVYPFLLLWFALCAVGANICYSFAYVLEFLFGSDVPTSHWLRFGRTTAFAGGVLFAIVLALVGGYNIANMAYYAQFK
jgi:hypothetical protein